MASLVGLPIVAVVGRPNVGKSTLFNRIVGERTAVVEDKAHTTRDRLYAAAEWNGRRFVLVDTGGLDVAPGTGVIEVKVQEQARLAISEADVIVFVVDAPAGLTASDREAADLLRSAKSPVLVAANKADNNTRELDALEFYELGWDETYPISALHGRGVADLLDAVVWDLPPESTDEIARKAREREADEWARDAAAGHLEPFVVGRDDAADGEDADDEEAAPDSATAEERRWDALMAAEGEDRDVAIAIVGRPNVGKSSLLNALLGEERAIVSDVPGTTRDAIDTPLAWGRSQIVLIDTAGVRRRGRVANGPAADRFATLRALRAVARADVAILVIDAVEGLTAQDAHIAGYVVEEGKGLLVVVNKWDLLTEKTDKTFDQYVDWIRQQAPFLDFAPVISISAKTHQRVDRVLEAAVDIWGERRKRVSTGELNRLMSEAAERQTAPMVKGRRPKLFYATQVAVAPPTFVFFAREAGSVHFSYRRYLENRLREAFGFDGTPVRLVFRERSSVQLEAARDEGRIRGPGPASQRIGGAVGSAEGRAEVGWWCRRSREGRRSEVGRWIPPQPAPHPAPMPLMWRDRRVPRRRRAVGPVPPVRRDRARVPRRDPPQSARRAAEGRERDGSRLGRVPATEDRDRRDRGLGTTMSVLLAGREPVTLLARRAEKAALLNADRHNDENLPGIALPDGVAVTADPSAIARADLVIFAVPSAHLREVAGHVGPFVAPSADVLSLVKGLEGGSLLRMSEVLAASLGIAETRIAALSGPNLAAEIARGLPASAVVGASDQDLGRRIQARVGTRAFRVYVNSDIVGVELCGALKNIVAIAAGAADGLGFGDNGKAGLITRGLAEMIRLGLAAGANPLTFAGLAGIGDVVATCASGLSRNHRLGVELAKGRRWADIEATLPGVAEGAYTVEAALALADRLGVEMPIAHEVRAALFEGKSVQRCLIDLLARESKDELADLPSWLDRAGVAAGTSAG